MNTFQSIVEKIGLGVDGAGVLIILVGLLYASVNFLQRRSLPAYEDFRHGVGRAILLGLEFLVAGDIIRTVAVAPTLENLYVLGLIVLIRTFLSFTLEIELKNRLPWESSRKENL